MFGGGYKSWRSFFFFCSLVHPSSPFSCWSKYSLSMHFSSTLNRYSSISVRDRVSHSYKATGEIMILFCQIIMFLKKRPKHKTLNKIVTSILVFNLLLIHSWMHFLFITALLKSLKVVTLSMHLTAIGKLWFYPVFQWQGTAIHSVFSIFNSRPDSLLASNRVSVFSFMVYVFTSNILKSSAWTKISYFLLNSNPSLFSWIFLMAYSTVKLKINGEKILLSSDHSEYYHIHNMYFYLYGLHYNFRLNIF